MINDKNQIPREEIFTGVISSLALGWILLGADSGGTFA